MNNQSEISDVPDFSIGEKKILISVFYQRKLAEVDLGIPGFLC